MDWTVWLLFVLTEGALTLTPGPAVLFVVSQGLRIQTARVLWSAVGILTINAFYFTLSGTGVGVLLAASDNLYTVVKWLGAGYLLYRGGMALLRPAPIDQASDDGSGSTRGSLLVQGVIVQLSNPKALLFFVAILPQFIDRSRPVLFQLVVLGVTSIVLEFAVLSAYAAGAARAARVALQPRFATATSRLSGGLLVVAALGVLRLER